MYWPNGVPRVYAVNGPGIPFSISGEDEELRAQSSRSNDDSIESHGRRQSLSAKPAKWADEAIKGLCVARSGHLFATMTDSSIAVWQTRVRAAPLVDFNY